MNILREVAAVVTAVGAELAARQPAEPVPAETLAEAFAVFEQYDSPAARQLRERLTALRPQAAWLDDELTGRLPTDGEWWVCDATDGAVQYLHGLPHWAVTATLVRDGEPVLAVVHAPSLGMTYTATRGGGTLLNGRPAQPQRRELAAAVVATSQPPFAGHDPHALHRSGASLSAVAAHVLAVRNLGPTALQIAHVGSGHLSAFWQYGTDPANLLPSALIAAESRATVTDATGAPWTPSSDSFVAAAPSLHGDLIRTLTEAVS